MSRPTAWVHRLGAAAWAVLTALLVHGGEAGRAGTEETLQVEWGHCTVLVRDGDPVCLYDPNVPVRLWIDDPGAAHARVWIDGDEVETERYSLEEEPHGEGRRVVMPHEARALAVEVRDDRGARRFELALRAVDPDASPGAVVERVELLLALHTDDVARIERAARALADALAADAWLDEAVLYLCAASFELQHQRAFDAAERLLVYADVIGRNIATHRKTVATLRGDLAWSQGALREAALRLREGSRLSLRLEEEAGLADALPIYAEALAELGYYEEARHWARASLRYLPEDACSRATLLRTIGWIHFVLRARDQPHDDPRPRLEQAIEVYRDSDCPHKQSAARLSLALLALGDGDTAAAERELRAIDVAALSAVDRVRAADLRVRLRLRTDADTVAARRAWDELRAAARVVDDDDARWRVEVRHGELLERDGNAGRALEAYGRAERHLDRLVRAQAVLGVGLTATADRYLEGTTALVSLLVAEGREAQAFCVAREAQARRRSAAPGIEALPAARRTEVEAKIRRYRALKQLAEETEAQVLEQPQAQEPGLRHEAEHTARAASELADEIVETLMRATASPRCEELVPRAPGSCWSCSTRARTTGWCSRRTSAGRSCTRSRPRARPTGSAIHGRWASSSWIRSTARWRPRRGCACSRSGRRRSSTCTRCRGAASRSRLTCR